jgi:hypothetical protein
MHADLDTEGDSSIKPPSDAAASITNREGRIRRTHVLFLRGEFSQERIEQP